MTAKPDVPVVEPVPKKTRTELSAMRLIVQTLEGQTPFARFRIIAYLSDYFKAHSERYKLPPGTHDPRD